MKSLELKIPPPVVAVVSGLGMWGISRVAPHLPLPASLRLAGCTIFVIASVFFSVAGVVSFRRARTTLNPTRPEATSSLVSSGIFRITRNPMYLGLTLFLVAWAIFLSSAVSLLGPAVFVLYVRRFQIVPEERILAELFGSEYVDYRARVRRWL